MIWRRNTVRNISAVWIRPHYFFTLDQNCAVKMHIQMSLRSSNLSFCSLLADKPSAINQGNKCISCQINRRCIECHGWQVVLFYFLLEDVTERQIWGNCWAYPCYERELTNHSGYFFHTVKSSFSVNKEERRRHALVCRFHTKFKLVEQITWDYSCYSLLAGTHVYLLLSGTLVNR